MKAATQQVNIALFCGGRGSATIIHELLRWPNIHLTLIVNAYDDGLSTGALRGFIAEMLGPSDFRKNLSYLLDPFSKGQYALKNLLEYRLPTTITSQDILNLIEFLQTEKSALLFPPLQDLFQPIEHALFLRVRKLLLSFFQYAQGLAQQFDFRDCALGNLIFAGAYLEKNNFNAAAKEMSQLVSSRALLVNASAGENRILVGLKEDGTFLTSEAEIVGQQSSVPIRHIFLVSQTIPAEKWQQMVGCSIAEKEAWLQSLATLPTISSEATDALEKANIIIYGPGTQHSSLLPSYQITQLAIKNSPATVKALIMNLEPDHDIQSFAAHDIVDRALMYLDDLENASSVITHILVDNNCALDQERLALEPTYKKSHLVQREFMNDVKGKVHNGHVVVETLMGLWEKSYHPNHLPAVDIFVDIFKRSLALEAISEEFLEMHWKNHFSHTRLTVNQADVAHYSLPDFLSIEKSAQDGTFPELTFFSDWLENKNSEYLVLLTGDGEYRFRDVMLGIQLLEQSHFGAVFGSRTQSRHQFKASLQAAYGEKKFLSFLSLLGAFFMSANFALRFGVIFSDPLTGFRIFKRSKIAHLIKAMAKKNKATPITIAKHLIKNNVEIAELPVSYRTFSGFTDPHWRIRRGVKNLLSTFTRNSS